MDNSNDVIRTIVLAAQNQLGNNKLYQLYPHASERTVRKYMSRSFSGELPSEWVEFLHQLVRNGDVIVDVQLPEQEDGLLVF